jgi:RNA polymerase-binding transcription factor DksA
VEYQHPVPAPAAVPDPDDAADVDQLEPADGELGDLDHADAELADAAAVADADLDADLDAGMDADMLDQRNPADRDGYDAVLAEAEQALDDVDHALRRLDDGTYGICEMCGEPISDRRLEELPAARTCEGHPQLTDQLGGAG